MEEKKDVAEEKKDLAKTWIDALRAKPLVALLIVASTIIIGAAGVVKAFQTISSGIQDGKESLSRPSVVAFTLSPRAGAYEEKSEFLFGSSDKKWRTFQPAYDSPETPSAIFLVTINNPGRKALIITRADYEVKQVGQVMGAPSGPLDSLATYHHVLKHEPGTQPGKLIPPFRIAPGETASFELEVRSASAGAGLGWLLSIAFVSNAGTFHTDDFQLFLPMIDENSAAGPQAQNAAAALGGATPNNDRSGLLARRRPSDHVPAKEIRDCAFRMAGITSEISALDELDKTMLFMRAGNRTPGQFAQGKTVTQQTYADLIPEEKRTRLQTIVKSRLGCEVN